MLRGVSTEESLRERFRSLSAAAGIPAPPLEVDDGSRFHEPRAGVETRDGVAHVVVLPELIAATPDEQNWHLAAALGWCTSPGPRRHRRRGVMIYLAILVPHLVVGGAAVFDNVAVPRWLAILGGPLLGFVLLLTAAALGRGEQHLLDAAGRDVLRSAGHDPATVARLAFGDRDDPPWYRRPLSTTPTPSERLTAAGAGDVRPARPLF